MIRSGFKNLEGFTLIELMITVAIAAVLLAVAVPSFTNTIKRNQIDSQLRELASHVTLARSEAISRSVTVTICRSNDQATCTSTLANGNWSDGWITFIDVDGDATVDLDDTLLRVRDDIGQNVLTVTDAAPAALNNFQFTRAGVSTRATFEMCEEDGINTMARALIMELTGRVIPSRDTDASGIFEDVLSNDLSC